MADRGAGRMRLPDPQGILIDRSKTVEFTFEGRRFSGHPGDTVASALAAHGEMLLSRSFKYHRARGALSMSGDDANSLVQIGSEPNVRADITPIADGMTVKGQNCIGGLAKDWGRWLVLMKDMLPVGFYYRTFFRPKGAWKIWEPVIRHLAGLGKVDVRAKDEPYCDKSYRFADVAVIGGGPAGMSAALEAASTGAQVMLIDDQPRLGGSLNYARPGAEWHKGPDLAKKLAAEIAAEPRIEVVSGAKCTGWFADNWLAVLLPSRLIKLRAGAVVAATGAHEQPMVFRNNDLPGVMLGSAAQRLIEMYGVKPGSRAVVATVNDDGYGVALDLADIGVEIAAIVDLRREPAGGPLEAAVRKGSVKILQGHGIREAVPSDNGQRVDGAIVAKLSDADGVLSGDDHEVDCDLLCMCGGYNPAAQLLCHSGGRLVHDDELSMLVVDELPAGGAHAFAAGSVNACFDLDAALDEGRHAGGGAARAAGHGEGAAPKAPERRKGARGVNHKWAIFPHPKGMDFVDFDEDLQIKDIVGAVKDGYQDLELVKRYSTANMGPAQGRLTAGNVLRIARDAGAKAPATTTQRPPCFPEPIRVLAGRSFQPTRLTAIHHRHVEAGAEMMIAGAWLRPAHYGRPGEDRTAAIERGGVAARERVGLIDVSTLGKLEIRGGDAAEFMERMYTFSYAKQVVGRSRYVMMLDQTGVIVDDGVACRFGDDHYYVTATTGGVDGVYQAMLRWNAEWRLDVDIANVTAAWAGVNLVGPKSREVLEKVAEDVDISSEGFPYLGVREGRVAGAPARLLRIGFVGELGYEIHVPAGCGEALWDALMDAGASHGIEPFGVETQRLLRLEKGHIIVSQDTDGLTTPEEASMTWAISRKKKAHFIGQRPAELHAKRPLKRVLSGFTMPKGTRLPEECHLTVKGGEITGHVTSVLHSPALDKIIGMAYIRPDQTDPGTKFHIKLSDGTLVEAESAKMPFYDPENKRQEL